MSSALYEVHEVIVAARPVAGVRAQVTRGRVGQEFGPHLEQVYAAGRAGGVALDGQNIFIYRAATAEELTVEFCVGVTAPFAAIGAVLPLETPHGVAAMTTHRGEYGRLSEANAAIVAWCRANNRLRAGPSWEVYGHWHADNSELRTDVYYLLRATEAAVGSWPPRCCRGTRRPSKWPGIPRARACVAPSAGTAGRQSSGFLGSTLRAGVRRCTRAETD